MSSLTVAGLEHTVQETHLWLKAVEGRIHREDRHAAYGALRAVLHALRDRLTPELAVHLGAQLPMLVRGVYYEGWHMGGKPLPIRTAQDFAEHVARELPPGFDLDALSTARAVFAVIAERIDPGESAKVVDHLPGPLKALWPAEMRR